MFFELSGKTHWVDACPLWAGTAEEVTLYRQRQLRRRIETERSETYAYAFTEIFVFEFQGENEITNAAEEKTVTFATANEKRDLQHASTEEGEAFMAFCQAYTQADWPYKTTMGQGLRKRV